MEEKDSDGTQKDKGKKHISLRTAFPSADKKSSVTIFCDEFLENCFKKLKAGGRIYVLTDELEFALRVSAVFENKLELFEPTSVPMAPPKAGTAVKTIPVPPAPQQSYIKVGIPKNYSTESYFERFWSNGGFYDRYFLAFVKKDGAQKERVEGQTEPAHNESQEAMQEQTAEKPAQEIKTKETRKEKKGEPVKPPEKKAKKEAK